MMTPQQIWAKEPALVIAVIDAILILAVTLGLPLPHSTLAAIDGLLAAAAGLAIRSQVSPIVK